MGLIDILITGVLALLGGLIGFGAWKFTSRRKKSTEEGDEESTEDGEQEEYQDEDPLFDDVVLETADMPPPPAPNIDIAAEFEGIRGKLREIAKAQISMLEAGRDDGSESSEDAQHADILTALSEHQSAMAEMETRIGARLDSLEQAVSAPSEVQEPVADPRIDTVLGLLENSPKDEGGANLAQISDLMLPQIALLGEDIGRLTERISEISGAVSALDMSNREILDTPQPVPDEPAAIPTPEPEPVPEVEAVAPVQEQAETVAQEEKPRKNVAYIPSPPPAPAERAANSVVEEV